MDKRTIIDGNGLYLVNTYVLRYSSHTASRSSGNVMFDGRANANIHGCPSPFPFPGAERNTDNIGETS